MRFASGKEAAQATTADFRKTISAPDRCAAPAVWLDYLRVFLPLHLSAPPPLVVVVVASREHHLPSKGLRLTSAAHDSDSLLALIFSGIVRVQLEAGRSKDIGPRHKLRNHCKSCDASTLCISPSLPAGLGMN